MMTNKDSRIKFRKGKQSEFLRRAADKVGSLRKLAKFLGLSWGNFWYYLNEQITFPYKFFLKLLPLMSLTEKEILDSWVETVLPKHWGAVKGAEKANEIIKSKFKDIKYKKKWIEKCRKGGEIFKGKTITNWDIGFRKAGKRNIVGPRGEKMFNIHEYNIAKFLLSKGLEYQYEPLVIFNNKTYFPDFIIGNTIIEYCGFNTKEYLKNLKDKLFNYTKNWNGQIIIVSPKRFVKYLNKIKLLTDRIIIISEDNLELMASVA